MPSGYTSKLPTDIIWDVAVFSVDVSGSQVAQFATRGGNSADPAMETRYPPFDGGRVPIAGMGRFINGIPKITGTALHLDEVLLAKLEPGSTVVTAGTPPVSTVTPKSFSVAIALADFFKKPTLTWARAGGGTVQFQMDYGEVMKWNINSKDRDEGEIPFEIEGRLDPAAGGFNTDKRGYIWIVTDPA